MRLPRWECSGHRLAPFCIDRRRVRLECRLVSNGGIVGSAPLSGLTVRFPLETARGCPAFDGVVAMRSVQILLNVFQRNSKTRAIDGS